MYLWDLRADVLLARFPLSQLTEQCVKGRALLSKAMRLHGGSDERFAKDVLGRARISIHRWKKGLKPIPEAVLARLRAYLVEDREP